jgi:hypothetical protein
MGIRFSCHLCNNPLHVKDYQAGKRGKCPKCQGSFRVPPADADFSLAIDESFSASPATQTSKKKVASPSIQPTAIQPTATDKPLATKPTTPATPKSPDPASPSLPKAPKHLESPSDELPASLLPYVDARWYVRPPSGGQYGPATTHTLLDWIQQRRVTADSLVWREGLENWGIVRDVIPEPFGGLPPTNGPIAQLPPTQSSPITSPAEAKPQPSTSSPNTPPTSLPLPTATTSKAAVTSKKKKQVRQQLWILGLLSVIAIGLVVALVLVLTRGA